MVRARGDIARVVVYQRFMMQLFSRFAKARPDVAIDLGTANMRIMVRGEGRVFEEPSLCCYDVRDGRARIVAAGAQVEAMIDRAPPGVVVRRPLARGVLQDIDAAASLLRHGIGSAIGRRWKRPAAIIGVPADSTKAEIGALLTAASDAGLGRVELIREPFAAALGAGLPVSANRASMVIECGAGTTEVAAFSIDGECRSRSVRLGGISLDEALMEHVHARHQFLIGRQGAEMLKRKLLALGPSAAESSQGMTVKGRSLRTGLPGMIILPVAELMPVVSRHFRRFADMTRQVLADISPDLAADLLDGNVVATGGGTGGQFLLEAISEQCGIRVVIAEKPADCVALGLDILLDRAA